MENTLLTTWWQKFAAEGDVKQMWLKNTHCCQWQQWLKNNQHDRFGRHYSGAMENMLSTTWWQKFVAEGEVKQMWLKNTHCCQWQQCSKNSRQCQSLTVGCLQAWKAARRAYNSYFAEPPKPDPQGRSKL